MATGNIIQLFISTANNYEKEIAFIEGKKQMTYAELLQQVQASAYYFTQKGIVQNDKVLVFIPMKSELYITVLALLYIGACPVFLDEWVSISRLRECLKTVPCKAVIAERKILFISWFINPLRKLVKIIPRSIPFSESTLPVETKPADTALVTFTTGSTGLPKAANRTHLFLAAQQAALQPLLSNHQITLTLLPVVILLNLSLGKTNVLPQQKLNIRRLSSVNYALLLIRQHGVESIIASPAITVIIAKQSLQQKMVTTIKQVITGGGPLFPDEAQHILHAFPEADATVVFGSTEAEPISTIRLKDVAITDSRTLQLQGLPVGAKHLDIQIAIIPFTTAPVPNLEINEWEKRKLLPGQSGEIVVSGPHVLQAYLNNDAAQLQNKFFVNDELWHRTGDEGTLDNWSNLYFRGRCTEVIDHKGDLIYPVISAWLLKQQVPVKEAAILISHHELLLVVEQVNKTLENKIMEALKGTVLEDITIRYLPSIPKDKRHQTKVDYEKLRRLLS